tara:strand:+ start:159 stop:530 length:372 start_codon:yes stop_codon:yes gene_type:complete
MFAKLLLIACFTLLPTCISAQDTWSKGDKLSAFFLCREEKDIMEIALADSKSKKDIESKIIEKRISQDCIGLRPPVLFVVDEVIASYIDHTKVSSCVLKIKTPNEMLVGYIIATGLPEKNKGI